MNTINNQHYLNFTAKVDLKNVKGGNRDWNMITKILEAKSDKFEKGIIEININKKGLLKDLCFDNRYVVSFDSKVSKKLVKFNDSDFADMIVETYKDWIWKINHIFK